MLDTIERENAILFDVSLLMGELRFIAGPHSASMMRRLADSLDRDLMTIFPDTFEETHVYKLVEFLRRIERS